MRENYWLREIETKAPKCTEVLPGIFGSLVAFFNKTSTAARSFCCDGGGNRKKARGVDFAA